MDGLCACIESSEADIGDNSLAYGSGTCEYRFMSCGFRMDMDRWGGEGDGEGDSVTISIGRLLVRTDNDL
jgi:hypothetical protein